MKKACALLLAALLLTFASGCGSLFEAEYDYEEPVTGDFSTLSGDAAEIRNYSMLKTALTDMISRHEEQGEFRLANYKGSPSEDLAAACYEIKSTNPLGAYAVESLSYDTSYVVSYYMANIFISYKRTAEELDRIVYAPTAGDFDRILCTAEDERAPDAVVRVYSSVVDEAYIRTLLRRHYYENPAAMTAEPEIRVESYPNEGANRVHCVSFDYAVSRTERDNMAAELDAALDAAASALTETEPAKLALEGIEWLSSLCTEPLTDRFSDTAYGAVLLHSSDSKAMALAFRALCGKLEIPCTVVEGSIGAMGAEPHFWNIIELEGAYYHVDASAFAAAPNQAFLLSDDALWGTYIWATEDYPQCSGTLRYSDVAELPGPEQPEETEAPEGEEEQPPTEETEEADHISGEKPQNND